MKKLLVVIPLVVLFLSLTIAGAGAMFAYEDPALCVSGEWLIVDAADPSAVLVAVPEGTPYGDQKAGGCKNPSPNVPILNVVVERGHQHLMRVEVNGEYASTPSVTVSHGADVSTKSNNGHRNLIFVFALQ